MIFCCLLAQEALTQSSDMDVCRLADQVVIEGLRSGRTLTDEEVGWAVRFEAASTRGECPTPPLSLLGQVPTGASDTVIAEAEARADGARAELDRWEKMFAAEKNMTVGEQIQFGWVGFAFEPMDETTPFDQASELEALSAKLGKETLLKFGGRFQMRERRNIDAYCAAAPGTPACAAQERGNKASWESAMTRKRFAEAAAEQKRLDALTPGERAYEEARNGTAYTPPSGTGYVGAGSTSTASATVTLRVYDQYGNYQGSTVTTSTEASLLGAK